MLNQYHDNINTYLKRFNLLFINIPKVASSTLWSVSAELEYGFYTKIKKDIRSIQLPSIKTSELSNYPDVTKVAFVRNPFDRLVSTYRNKIERKNKKFLKSNNLTPNVSFAEFVDYVCSLPDSDSDRHFRSQHTFIYDNEARLLINYLGRFDSFESDLAELKTLYDLPIKQIPHWNKEPTRSYTTYYNHKLIQKVQKRYALDLKFFGYQYDESIFSASSVGKLPPLLTSQDRLNVHRYKNQKLLRVIRAGTHPVYISQKHFYYITALKNLARRLLKRSKSSRDAAFREVNSYRDNANYYLENYNLLFYNIPKAGSSTLWSICNQLKSGNRTLSEDEVRKSKLPEILPLDVENHIKVKKVAFIRNPFARLVSVYKNKIIEKNIPFLIKNQLSPEITFCEFIDYIVKTEDSLADKHFRSQYTFLTSTKGEFIINDLGRLETFSEDLRQISEKYNLPKFSIPHWNKTDKLNYKEYYTPELIKKVKKRYAIDLHLFGYTFNSMDDIKKDNWQKALDLESQLEIVRYKSRKLLRIVRLLEEKS